MKILGWIKIGSTIFDIVDNERGEYRAYLGGADAGHLSSSNPEDLKMRWSNYRYVLVKPVKKGLSEFLERTK